MSAIRVALGASVRSGVLRDERINDDRFGLDLAHGLAFVADASGPTYGAYYAPFAIDPGLAALTSTFLSSGGSTRERLVAALQEAHAVMAALNSSYESQRAGRTGLVAARQAADAVRPQAWAGYDSHAHFGGSVTACAVGRQSIIVAQVGGCRAYRLRPGGAELLVHDHTLPSRMAAEGASREEIEHAGQYHATTVVCLLGYSSFELAVVELAAPARIALVTDGVWRHEGALMSFNDARSQADIERLVSRYASATRDDATAVLLDVA